MGRVGWIVYFAVFFIMAVFSTGVLHYVCIGASGIGWTIMSSTKKGRGVSKEALEKIETACEGLKLERREYRSVSSEDFAHLDLQWYALSERKLQGLGFDCVGDKEDVLHNTEHPKQRTFIRVFTHKSGDCVAALYQLKLPWLLRPFMGKGGSFRVTEFESETSDGHFFATTNATASAAIDNGPAVHSTATSAGTEAEHLMIMHRETLKTYLAENEGVDLVRAYSEDDAALLQDRLQATKSAYRSGLKSPMSHEDLLKLDGVDNETAFNVAAQLERRAQARE